MGVKTACVQSVSGTWHIAKGQVGEKELTACSEVVIPRKYVEVEDMHQDIPPPRGGTYPRICCDCNWAADGLA